MLTNDSPWFVRFGRRSSMKARLFCMHYAGGGAMTFRNWGKLVADDLDVVALQLPGRETRYSEKAYVDMRPLVSDLVTAIEHLLDMPYIFFGHSLGALISFEVIREIRRRGNTLPELFIPSGHHAPHMPDRKPPIYDADDEQFRRRLQLYDGTPAEILNDDDFFRVFMPVFRADFQVLGTYKYTNEMPLDCPILALDGTQDATVNENELYGWEQHTSRQFRYRRFVGGHFFIKPNENQITRLINEEYEDMTMHYPKYSEIIF